MNNINAKIITKTTEYIELTAEWLRNNIDVVDKYMSGDYGCEWFENIKDCDMLFCYDKELQSFVLNPNLSRLEFDIDYRHFNWSRCFDEYQLVNFIDKHLEKLTTTGYKDNAKLIALLRDVIGNCGWISACWVNRDNMLEISTSDYYVAEEACEILDSNSALIEDILNSVKSYFEEMITENNRIITNQYNYIFSHEAAIEEILYQYDYYNLDFNELCNLD